MGKLKQEEIQLFLQLRMFHLKAVKLVRARVEGGVLRWFKGHSYYGSCLTFCFEKCLLVYFRTKNIFFF